MENYDDIINLSRPVYQDHKPMPIKDRVAQFASFAALVGYDDAIEETARLTDKKLELDDDMAAELNEKFGLLKEHQPDLPEISIEYFIPDNKKSGGKYVWVQGCFKGIDEFTESVVMTDGTKIPIADIYKINSDLFSEFGL